MKEILKLDLTKLNIWNDYEDWVIKTPSSSEISQHDSVFQNENQKEVETDNLKNVQILKDLSKVDEEPFDILFESNHEQNQTQK